MQISHPSIVIRLFDNSTNPSYTNWMNSEFHRLYGTNNHKFKAYYIPCRSKSVIERMTFSTEAMRQYAVTKNFEYLMSIEVDVFPTHDVIERLMSHNKLVVGALYDRDEGMYRKLCIQKIIKEAPDSLLSANFKPGEELGFVDGSLKKVSSVGLGCCLINMNVLKNLPFRYFNDEVWPDMYFSESMSLGKIKIYADTSCVVKEHKNQEWIQYYL